MSRGRRVIPRKYSENAIYTSLFILHLSLVSFRFQEYITSFLALCLFISTNLHWKDVRESGFYREVDKIIVKLNFLWSVYTAYKYDCRFRYYMIMLVNISAFLINENLNKRTLYDNSYMRKITPIQRKLLYVRVCFIHWFFLHFLQCELGIWVMYNCNKECS